MREGLRIGTRGSILAMRQTQWVAARLTEHHPDLPLHIEILKTTGDRIQDAPLAKLGSVGVFTRELDLALREGQIDVAVHSLKDVPTSPAPGVALAAIPEREDPRDVFVGRFAPRLLELPSGASVGTGSLRRRALLAALRPDLQAVELRGNIDTRLRKLRESDVMEGIILAAAGVLRTGMSDVITEWLDVDAWLPAPGQGALAIAVRSDDARACNVVRVLEHPPTRTAVTAERALLACVESGCHAPVGAFGFVSGSDLSLDAFVASPTGGRMVRLQAEGPAQEAARLGEQLAARLLREGGREILDALNRGHHE